MDKKIEIELANKFVEWHREFFEEHKCKPNIKHNSQLSAFSCYKII